MASRTASLEAPDRSSPLRRVLVVDAMATGAAGLLMLAGGGFLDDRLDLSTALLRWAGLILIVYAGLVWWVGMRPVIPRVPIAAFITINIAWGIGCLVLLAGDRVDPSGLGVAFILAHVAVVTIVAAAQWRFFPR